MLSKTKHLLLISLLTVVFGSCKVTQKTTLQTDTTDTLDLAIIIDTVKTEIIQDSVELKVYRLIKDTLRIIGVGDMMLGTNYPDDSYLPPDSGKYLLSAVDTILRDADVTFGNLEGVILNEGGDAKYCKNPKICYIFRSPEYMVQHLLEAGFDVLSTANNHAGDFGDPGRINTARVLDSLGLYHAGQLTQPYTSFMVDGMKYGFTAFAPNTGTVSINDLENAVSIVKHLDSLNDVVIVSFHGGAEGSKYENVTRKNEYFYGEDRGNVYNFTHTLVDAGADVIFGHGPHVTRAIEIYNDRFIAYSLGNFCTYARFNLSGANGMAPIIKVFTDHEGKFLTGQIIPIIQRPPGGPKFDEKKRVISKLQQLTEKDFPEVKIMIDDSGLINYIRN